MPNWELIGFYPRILSRWKVGADQLVTMIFMLLPGNCWRIHPRVLSYNPTFFLSHRLPPRRLPIFRMPILRQRDSRNENRPQRKAVAWKILGRGGRIWTYDLRVMSEANHKPHHDMPWQRTTLVFRSKSRQHTFILSFRVWQKDPVRIWFIRENQILYFLKVRWRIANCLHVFLHHKNCWIESLIIIFNVSRSKFLWQWTLDS